MPCKPPRVRAVTDKGRRPSPRGPYTISSVGGDGSGPEGAYLSPPLPWTACLTELTADGIRRGFDLKGTQGVLMKRP